CCLDDGAPLPALDEGVVEYGELAAVDLQRIPVPGEREHQPLGTGAFHVPRLDTRRESAKSQGLPPIGVPLDRRTRELDVCDGPLLLRFAPQREGDGATAEYLILPFSSEDVLELDVTEKCLRFGDEIVDRLTTVTAALGGSCLRDRSCRFLWSGMLFIDQRRPHLISGAAGHRMSSKDQGRQYEHNQRSPVSGRCVHPTDSTDEPVLRRRARIKEFDVVEENPLAIGPTSTVVAMRTHALFHRSIL